MSPQSGESVRQGHGYGDTLRSGMLFAAEVPVPFYAPGEHGRDARAARFRKPPALPGDSSAFGKASPGDAGGLGGHGRDARGTHGQDARATRGAAQRRRGGFTMVEILATLVLAAIVLPSVMRGMTLCLATAGEARHRTEAAALAKAKMSELIATDPLQDASQGGDFGDDWPEYRWEAQTSDYDSALQLRQLDVGVSWKRAGQEHRVIFSTIVYVGGDE